MKKIVFISLFLFIIACKESQKRIAPKKEVKVKESRIEKFIRKVEQAHQKEVFTSKEAIVYEVNVSFGGKTILEGVVTQFTDGSKIRIDKKDGTNIVFDGKDVFMFPKDREDPMARFHIFTWSYFFSLPYKLKDEGTVWSNASNKKWGDKQFETARLTFKDEIGDSPKDWYVLYKNPIRNYLEGAAYIVSFGKDLAEAEKEPHAIKYCDFSISDGVPFANKWTFHMWSDKDGYGDQIGEVNLNHIFFVRISDGLFDKPADYKLIEAPVVQ